MIAWKRYKNSQHPTYPTSPAYMRGSIPWCFHPSRHPKVPPPWWFLSVRVPEFPSCFNKPSICPARPETPSSTFFCWSVILRKKMLSDNLFCRMVVFVGTNFLLLFDGWFFHWSSTPTWPNSRGVASEKRPAEFLGHSSRKVQLTHPLQIFWMSPAGSEPPNLHTPPKKTTHFHVEVPFQIVTYLLFLGIFSSNLVILRILGF